MYFSNRYGNFAVGIVHRNNYSINALYIHGNMSHSQAKVQRTSGWNQVKTTKFYTSIIWGGKHSTQFVYTWTYMSVKLDTIWNVLPKYNIPLINVTISCTTISNILRCLHTFMYDIWVQYILCYTLRMYVYWENDIFWKI